MNNWKNITPSVFLDEALKQTSFVPIDSIFDFLKNGGLVVFQEVSMIDIETGSYVLCNEDEKMFMYQAIPEDTYSIPQWKLYMETRNQMYLNVSCVSLYFYSLEKRKKYIYYLYVSSNTKGVLPFPFEIIK
jgi:uncharacterized membrane protein